MIGPGGSPGDGRRPPISPRLALRVAILGGVALVLFAVVFFRLWYLQVLSGDSYRAEANQNRVREVRVPAPRGEIKDRDGNVLVANRPSIVVELQPRSLPGFELAHANKFGQRAGRLARKRARYAKRVRQAKRGAHSAKSARRRAHAHAKAAAARAKLRALPKRVPLPGMPDTRAGRELHARFARLGHVLGLPEREVQARVVHQLYLAPYANVRLKSDVSRAVYGYLLERAGEFPGIQTQEVVLRSYPHGALAAQLFGTVGQISPAELRDKAHYRGIRQGTIIGQSGIESAYDRYLRGRDGAERISVDAAGQPTGRLSQIRPVSGKDLRLTLRLRLQKAGQRALAEEMGAVAAPAAAFVALDPTNGAVLAMGSLPSFDPNLLTKPLTQGEYDAKLGPAAGDPQLNRATQSAYPTGSTFKPITAVAAMETGVIGPDETIDDTGVFHDGNLVRHNAGNAAYGVISMANAIRYSSDVFFYTLGHRLYEQPGLPLQKWAHALGMGHRTGIDIPGENGGVIPGPAYRKRMDNEEKACEKRRHVPTCNISIGGPEWREGDEVNTAVGQGDVQATPLQLAVVYSALENGGRIVTPHVGFDVENRFGSVIQQIRRGRTHSVSIKPEYRDVILQGLHAATSESGGTSAEVFAGWPQDRYPVYGKTGTAQTGLNRRDQSWYVSFVPDPQHPIVVAVTLEHGGFGASAAAPVACRILSSWYRVHNMDCSAGSSEDN